VVGGVSTPGICSNIYGVVYSANPRYITPLKDIEAAQAEYDRRAPQSKKICEVFAGPQMKQQKPKKDKKDK